MKIPKIADAVGYIDDALITAAAGDGKKTAPAPWLKWGCAAACFALAAALGAAVLPQLFDGGAGTSGKYQYRIDAPEADVEWPWEYKTNGERYQTIRFNGGEYRVKYLEPLGEELLGETLGSCPAEGVDSYTGRRYTQTLEIRRITGVSQERLVAGGVEGEFYVYALDGAEKPGTLGEVMELYGLARLLKLDRFTLCEGYEEVGCYSLADDAPVWQTLSECGGGELYSGEDPFDRGGRSYLTFTATSPALGVYKRVIYISEDGYFATNIFDYSYIYFIGEAAADSIIRYVMSNSAQAASEPFETTVAGTLTEIGDGYVLIDDSVLCADERDGTVYKVSTGDIRMRRWIEAGGIEVGDTVVVKYSGGISEDSGIDGAYAMLEGTLVDGGLFSIAE